MESGQDANQGGLTWDDERILSGIIFCYVDLDSATLDGLNDEMQGFRRVVKEPQRRRPTIGNRTFVRQMGGASRLTPFDPPYKAALSSYAAAE